MIKIKDIMTKEVVTASPGSSIVEAARLMASKSVSSLVITEKGRPIAVVSEDDIIRGASSGKKSMREIMSKYFLVISPLTRFSKVENSIRQKKIKRFPVVEDEKLVGLVTETDIIQATRDFTRFHQVVQEMILAIFGLATAFFLFYFSPLGASVFSPFH
ncbi:CBS domain-containing protein [Candidatus Woesearchaeota archaeon]|nr:CBS domain-containing protein [Candidatus Woesearchaeota archaeon]